MSKKHKKTGCSMRLELQSKPYAQNSIKNDEIIRQCNELVRKNKKVEAIKLYRSHFKCNLSTAIDAITSLW